MSKQVQSQEKFFRNFLREFKAGLRLDDKNYVDELIQDLLEISLVIPPMNGKQFTFREILMLMTFINQKKLHEEIKK